MKDSNNIHQDVESPHVQPVEEESREKASGDSPFRGNSWSQKPGLWLTAISVAFIVLLGLAIGLLLGLHDCDDSANKGFQVTLTVETVAPMIETSNTESVNPSGTSSKTVYFPYYPKASDLTPLFSSTGQDRWSDYQSVRVRRIDDANHQVSVTVEFHNLDKMNHLMETIFPTNNSVSEPECLPAAHYLNLVVPLDASSDEFTLGTCGVTRSADDTTFALEPSRVDVRFTGIVSVDRGWEIPVLHDTPRTARPIRDATLPPVP